MKDHRIQPHKVTKPLQLLAAWLVGLVAIDTAFLAAANMIEVPIWAPALLVVAAVVNVPIFLVCLFLLQTRFRPEMQEDEYYSRYLETKTGKIVSTRAISVANAVAREAHQIRSPLNQALELSQQRIALVQRQVEALLSSENVGTEARLRLRDLSAEAADSGSAVSRAQDRSRWATLRIEVNDLLPGYPKIREGLQALGASPHETFGSDSIDPAPPAVGILSFGDDVPMDAVRSLLSVLRPFGIDHVDYDEDPMHRSRVYIGSYTYMTEPGHYAKVADEIEAALNDTNIDTHTFCKLIQERYSPNKSA